MDKKCKCGKEFKGRPSRINERCGKVCGYKYRDMSTQVHMKKGERNCGSFKKGFTPWNKQGEGKEKFSNIIKKHWEKGNYKGTRKGKLNGRYIDGRQQCEPYKYILEERGYICENCKVDKNIIVHHKDKNRMNSKRNNLQVLCQGCHMVLHIHGVKYFEARKKR